MTKKRYDSVTTEQWLSWLHHDKLNSVSRKAKHFYRWALYLLAMSGFGWSGTSAHTTAPISVHCCPSATYQWDSLHRCEGADSRRTRTTVGSGGRPIHFQSPAVAQGVNFHAILRQKNVEFRNFANRDVVIAQWWCFRNAVVTDQ